jgi:cytochrome P450
MPGIRPDLPLTDAAFYASEPWDTYRWLRDESPVYWCAPAGFWAITRHEDVLRVSKDPETYCSGEGMTMRGGELSDVPGGATLITLDPPRHTSQRAIISRAFTPGAVSRLECHIHDIARRILDEVPAGEPLDFVESVAAPLPVIVIAELLGVPVEDRDKFVAWSNASIGVADPEYAHLRDSMMLEQYEYFEQILRNRRRRPVDDLLSIIVGAEADDEDLTHADVLSLCFLLLAAGNETTRNLITQGVLALVRHPDQLDLLRERGDVRTAVEELMRWVSPVIHMARTVTVDTVVRDAPLRAGDQVVLLYGAANRDERVFGADADDLVVTRNPNPHLGFGFGTHFCLGAALARLEAKVVCQQLLERFRTWRVVGPVERLHSTMILGIRHLPVVLDN